MRRRYLLAAFLAALAILAWWSGDLVQPPLVPPPQVTSERLVDYYFEEFRMVSMDATGRRDHLLAGRRLEHYREDGSSSLVEPTIEFEPAEAPAWTVESERGWLSPDRRIVRLEGAVTMVRSVFADAPALRIETFDLTIDTDRSFASTGRPVRLLSPGLTVDAVGMTTQFDQGLLSLLSDVRGVYVKTGP